nr:DUF2851 family protein [Prevotella sp.]
MELLLHYVWKHKLFPLTNLLTYDGQTVEVIDPGLHNTDAGPDFFNAKIKINGILWVGNVEIHDSSHDWYVHGHDKDERYDNVILHVCGKIDSDVRTKRGDSLPQIVLEIPDYVSEHYKELLSTDSYPPCYKIIPNLSQLMIHSWMNALQTERLEEKTEAINMRVTDCELSWESGYFVTIAHNYGFGINGDIFEQWAMSIPLHELEHIRDNLFQIETIFMGQAGLLQDDAIPLKYRDLALSEGYLSKMQNEYAYLAHKFNLKPMDYHLWKFLRLRPQNFPHIRIAQLANLYFQRKTSLMTLIESSGIKDIKQLLKTNVTPYWETHYSFGATSKKNRKWLSSSSLNLLLINTAVPMLFAYGKHKQDERLCYRATEILEQLNAENNYIVRMWQKVGLMVENAGDSQALIQLKKNYCDKKDCLRCRIGYEYLKTKS